MAYMVIGLLVIFVSGSGEYGHYKFWNNVGGVFLDYGGNNYHAILGQQIGSDPQDGYLTDRGVCIDSNDGAILVHNNFYGIPQMNTDFSIQLWALVRKKGNLLARECFLALSVATQSQLDFNFYLWQYDDSLWGYDWTDQGEYNFGFNVWHHIYLAVRNDKSGIFEFFVVLDGDQKTPFTIEDSALYEQDAVDYITAISYQQTVCYSSGFYDVLTGLFYELIISQINYQESVYSGLNYSTSCSNCYFGASYDCQCSFCPSNGYCLSTQTDCLKAADGTQALYCENHSVWANEVCQKCQDSSWPVCEINTSSLSYHVCAPICESCFGILQTECYSCIGSNSLYMDQYNECQCPSQSTFDGQDCVCDSPGQTIDTVCTGCTVSRVDNSSTYCQCPTNAQFSEDGTTCVCSQGFFDTDPASSSEIICQQCDDYCKTCTDNNPENCSQCIDGYYQSNQNQSCVQKICDAGKYAYGSSCKNCHEICLTCNGGGQNDCLSCTVNEILEDGTCVAIQCKIGSYLNEGSCVQCNQNCYYCNGPDETDCINCRGNKVVDSSTGLCVCGQGYYDYLGICQECSAGCQICDLSSCSQCYQGYVQDGIGGCTELNCSSSQYVSDQNTCQDCNPKCLTCDAGTVQDCLSCATGLILESDPGPSQCKCEDGTFWSDSDCNSCDSSCLTCNGGTYQNCMSCNTGLTLVSDPGPSECLCDGSNYWTGSMCDSCDLSCLTCNGGDPSDCMSCNTGLTLVSDPGPSECLCDGSYYWTGSICHPCDPSCLTCNDKNSRDCLSCGSGLTLSSTPGDCICDGSTYWTGSSCENCDLSCLTCNGSDISDCLSCDTGLTLNPNPGPGQCQCDIGTYWTGSFCDSCNPSCLTCSGGTSSDCLSCDSGLTLDTDPGPSQCQCDGSNYWNGSMCDSCYSSCLTCNGETKSDCLTCNSDLTLNSSPGPSQCLCSDGKFWNLNACVDCQDTCLTCDGGTSYDCLSCPQESTLRTQPGPAECVCNQGTYRYGLICENCHQTCKACQSNTETDCTSCNSPDVLIIISLSGSLIGNCKQGGCQEGTFYSDFSCKTCHVYCKTCSGQTQLDCIDCIQGYQMDQNQCVFQYAVCQQGYYQYQSSCELCHQSCLACNGPSDFDCTSCQQDYNLTEAGTCLQNPVQCSQGYYNYLNECKNCYQKCKTCVSDSVYSCTSCFEGYTLLYTGECQKECEQGFYQENGDCLSCYEDCKECKGGSATDCTSCEDRKYLIQGSCEQCQVDCQTCVSFPECETCIEQDYTPDQGGGCSLKCEQGQFVNNSYQCEDCGDNCEKCYQKQKCQVCIENSVWTGDQCECEQQYHQYEGECRWVSNFTVTIFISEQNIVFLQFQKELKEKLQKTDLQLQADNFVVFQGKILNQNYSQVQIHLQFQSSVPPQTTLSLSFTRAIQAFDNSYLQTQQLEKFLYQLTLQELEQIQQETSTASKSIFSSALMFGALAGFPPSVWSLINTVQIFAYIALSSNPLTPDLRAFLQGLANYNPISNVPSQFLAESKQKPFAQAYLFGFQSYNFIINIGRQFTILCVLVSIGFLLVLVNRNKKLSQKGPIKSLTQKFAYSIYLRYWLQFYIKVTYCSLLQLLEVIFRQKPENLQETLQYGTALVFLVSFIQIISVASPFLCFYMINQTLKNSTGNSEIENKIETMKYEFKQNGDYLQMQYYPLFLFRRNLMAFSLVFFLGYPVTQTIINIFLSFIVKFRQIFLYIIVYSPFGTQLFQLSNSITEIGTLIVMGLTTVFLFEVEEQTKQGTSYAIIGIIFGVVLGNLLVSIIKSIQNIIEKIKKRKKGDLVNEKKEEQDEYYDTGTQIYQIPKPFRRVMRKSLKKPKSEAVPDINSFFNRYNEIKETDEA